MLQKILKTLNLQLLLIIFSAAALLGAYISQYVFDMEPCILCLYQRIPHFVVIFLASISLKMDGMAASITVFLSGLVLLVGAAIAGYHVGVENGIFEMSSGCTDIIASGSFEEMRNAVLGSPSVPCDKPQFVFLGISMAGYNLIYSTVFAFITLMSSASAFRSMK